MPLFGPNSGNYTSSRLPRHNAATWSEDDDYDLDEYGQSADLHFYEHDPDEPEHTTPAKGRRFVQDDLQVVADVSIHADEHLSDLQDEHLSEINEQQSSTTPLPTQPSKTNTGRSASLQKLSSQNSSLAGSSNVSYTYSGSYTAYNSFSSGSRLYFSGGEDYDHEVLPPKRVTRLSTLWTSISQAVKISNLPHNNTNEREDILNSDGTRFHDVRHYYRRPNGRMDRVENGELSSHEGDVDFSEEMDLVDEHAIHIMSLSRLKADRLRYLLCLLTFAGFILVFTGLALSLNTQQKSSSSHTPPPPPLSLSNSTLKINWENKNAIDTVCSLSTLDQSACRQACLVSTCCRSTDQDQNCYADFKAFCTEYVSCNYILHPGESKIPDILSPTNPIHSSFSFTNYSNYTNYANVQAVIHKDQYDTYVDGLSFDQIEQMLIDLCQDDSTTKLNLSHTIQRQKCQDACAPAACCFVPENDPQYCGSADVCGPYDACLNLKQNQDSYPSTDLDRDPFMLNAKLEWHTNSIKQVCEDEFNKQQCLEACLPGECCFEPNDTAILGTHIACVSDFDCEPYFDCDILVGNSPFGAGLINLNLNVVSSQANLNDAQDELIRDQVRQHCADISQSSLDSCLQTCKPAECCFGPHFIASANACDPSIVRSCEPYQQCSALVDLVPDFGDNDSATMDAILADINSKCDDLSTSNLRLQCSQACKNAQCCYDHQAPAGSCAEAAWCEPYKPCENLINFVLTDNDDDYISSETISAQNDVDIQAALEEVCDPKAVDLTDPTDRLECSRTCRVATCCFESLTCQDEAWCKSYKLCNNLISTDNNTENSISTDINTENSISTDINTENSMSKEINTENTNMYTNTNLEYEMTQKVDQVCMIEGNIEKCLKACQPAECCYQKQSLCKVVDIISCDAYSSCQMLIGKTDFASSTTLTSTYPTFKPIDGIKLTGAVEAACDDYASQECLDLCRPATCCFNSDTACPPDFVGCDPYEACEVLLETTDFAK